MSLASFCPEQAGERASQGRGLGSEAPGWVCFCFFKPSSLGSAACTLSGCPGRPFLTCLPVDLLALPGALVGSPTEVGVGHGAWSPSLVTPGLLHTFVLCFTVPPSPPSPPAPPLSRASIPFGFPHFSLEWVSYPQLCSGLTLLNTNKTHSTQVEQGARARCDK